MFHFLFRLSAAIVLIAGVLRPRIRRQAWPQRV